MATFTVSNANDGIVNSPGDQPGTLRQAIFDARLSLDANDVIEFAASLNGGTVTLTQGELSITDSLSSPLQNSLSTAAFQTPRLGGRARLLTA